MFTRKKYQCFLCGGVVDKPKMYTIHTKYLENDHTICTSCSKKFYGNDDLFFENCILYLTSKSFPTITFDKPVVNGITMPTDLMGYVVVRDGEKFLRYTKTVFEDSNLAKKVIYSNKLKSNRKHNLEYELSFSMEEVSIKELSHKKVKVPVLGFLPLTREYYKEEMDAICCVLYYSRMVSGAFDIDTSSWFNDNTIGFMINVFGNTRISRVLDKYLTRAENPNSMACTILQHLSNGKHKKNDCFGTYSSILKDGVINSTKLNSTEGKGSINNGFKDFKDYVEGVQEYNEEKKEDNLFTWKKEDDFTWKGYNYTSSSTSLTTSPWQSAAPIPKSANDTF